LPGAQEAAFAAAPKAEEESAVLRMKQITAITRMSQVPRTSLLLSRQ
jgi:hypothetical protein